MPSVNLGRVRMVPKGAWSGAATYVPLDVVTHGGESFVAIAAMPAGTATTSTAHWQKIAAKGDPGPPGASAWADITGKPATFPPAAHTHAYADLTGLPALFSGAWADVTGKPATFPPAAHGHPWSDLTGVPATFAPAAHSHPTAEVTGLDAALAARQITAEKGAANGYAGLDAAGQVPAAQLPPFRNALGLLAPIAGAWIGNAFDGAAVSTQAQAANRSVIAPVIMARDTVIDQVGISISAAVAAALFKVVLYDSDANGRPTAVLAETGTIDAATTGTKTIALPAAQTLVAGKVYWLGIRSSSTATLRTLPLASVPSLGFTTAATPANQPSLILTETFANPAAAWTYAEAQKSTALPPLVLMRVA